MTDAERLLTISGIDYATAERIVDQEWGSVLWCDGQCEPAFGVKVEFSHLSSIVEPTRAAELPEEPTRERIHGGVYVAARYYDTLHSLCERQQERIRGLEKELAAARQFLNDHNAVHHPELSASRPQEGK